MQTAVAGLQDKLCAEIERGFINGREGERGCPRIAIFALRNVCTEDGHGPRGNVLGKGALPVPAGDSAIAAAFVNYVGVFGVDGEVATFGSASGEPIARCDLVVIGAAEHGCGTTVLLSAIDGVGKAIVGGYVVELRCRLVVPG